MQRENEMRHCLNRFGVQTPSTLVSVKCTKANLRDKRVLRQYYYSNRAITLRRLFDRKSSSFHQSSFNEPYLGEIERKKHANFATSCQHALNVLCALKKEKIFFFVIKWKKNTTLHNGIE